MAIHQMISLIRHTIKPQHFIALGLFLFSLVSLFEVARSLPHIPDYYFDEPYYINGSESLLTLDAIENWEHPPLGKYLIALGRRTFVNPMLGARSTSFIAFLLASFALSLAASRLCAKFRFLGFATCFFLLSTDPFVLCFSKTAMLDIFAFLFICLSILAYCFLIHTPVIYQKAMVWMGMVIGLGALTKWNTIPVNFVLVFWLFRRTNFQNLSSLFLVGGSAVAVYLLGFAPYLFVEGSSVSQILKLQIEMFGYHGSFSQGDNVHASPWWSWPLLIKPLWLFMKTTPLGFQGLLTLPNLVTYSFGLALGIWSAFRHQKESHVFFWGYLVVFGVWALSSRETTYFHYYLLAVPFLILMFTQFLHFRMEKNRYLIAGSLIFMIALTFKLYSPLVTAEEISLLKLSRLLWLPTWRYPF